MKHLTSEKIARLKELSEQVKSIGEETSLAMAELFEVPTEDLHCDSLSKLELRFWFDVIEHQNKLCADICTIIEMSDKLAFCTVNIS